jgi:hypothetical protein
MLIAAEVAEPVPVGLEDEVDSSEAICEEETVFSRPSAGLAEVDVERHQATGMTSEQRAALAEHLAFVRGLFANLPMRRGQANATRLSRLLWLSSDMFYGRIVAREAIAAADGTPRAKLTLQVDTDCSGALPAGAYVEIHGDASLAAFERVHTGEFSFRDQELTMFLLRDNGESELLAAFPVSDGLVSLFGTLVPEADLALVFEAFRWARGEQ